MWAAIVLICHMSLADEFKMNQIPEVGNRQCYMSMAPALLKTEKACLDTIKVVMDDPKFVKVPNYELFSFECFEWDNHHYLGQSI